MLTKVIPEWNILFALEMIAAVKEMTHKQGTTSTILSATLML